MGFVGLFVYGSLLYLFRGQYLLNEFKIYKENFFSKT